MDEISSMRRSEMHFISWTRRPILTFTSLLVNTENLAKLDSFLSRAT